MKVYAEYLIENNMSFRMNTILQFGNSWELIGNIVLANPGSAEATDKLDDESIMNLNNFYKRYKCNQRFESKNWHEFAPDQTMYRIEKIFGGGYIGEKKELNGVIQLFNTFNIKNQYLEEAIGQIDLDSNLLFSIGIEKYFHDKPTYFGFSKSILNNKILKSIAKDIFDNSTIKVKELYNNTFEENSFYHPSYINRAVNQKHFQWYKKDILTPLFKLI